VVVREVPVLLAKTNLEQMINDLLAEMAEYGTADGLNRHGLDLLGNIACPWFGQSASATNVG
jgi:DNA mismatch repair protein MutL